MKGGIIMSKRDKLFDKFFLKKSKKVSPEILTLIDEDVQKAIYRAYELNNITDKDVIEKPIILKMPESFYESGTVNFLYHEKQNDVIYDQSLLVALFIGKKTMYYYQANIDHRTGLIAGDIAGEIALDTVTNVETIFSSDDKDTHKSYLDLELSTADGNTYSFRLRNQYVENPSTHKVLLNENEKYVLSQVKEAVRRAY
jgi:hypothetical protein